MSVVAFRRGARRPGPPLPQGDLDVQEPPALPEPAAADMSSLLMVLPMLAGSGAMLLIFVRPGSGPLGYVAAGLMGVAALGMLVFYLGRAGGDRKRRLRGERRDYLRYLTQLRRQVRRAAVQQAASVCWTHPEPGNLWSVAGTRRMWERRTTHPDFAEVRTGTSRQRLTVTVAPPATKPVEDLEPLCAGALRRFLEAHTSVPGLPVAVGLRSFARVVVRPASDGDGGADAVDGAAAWRILPAAEEAADDHPPGDREPSGTERVRGFARALLAQLAAFHAPDDLRIVIAAPADRLAHWDWAKWLPHVQDPDDTDGAGSRRLVATSSGDLDRLLAAVAGDRPSYDAAAQPGREEPYLVVVTDGITLPPTSRLAGPGLRNAVVVHLDDAAVWRADPLTLRLRLAGDAVEVVGIDEEGRDAPRRLCRPDDLPQPGAGRLARLLSPYRVVSGGDAAESLAGEADFPSLLGLGDPDRIDPAGLRERRSRWEHLRVPIGTTEGGTVVEVDLKEAAQGGMGPHGMLIGATGSGKSELLRTLLLALAVTHSAETLNLVLVDFKGGATFLGFEQLPHTSAVITNLADELPLVDRMQEALQGELVRRQELLRRSGHSSARDHEAARARGADLEPLPSLLVVVDEFSELLSSKRDFIDLFVMIGRLGRSLGVHLLLASQRLDEGRVHQLESHLSYRIGLKTFSASESRAVLGVPDAHTLPASPGNGFLRSGPGGLTRFRASYVSAPWRVSGTDVGRLAARRQVAPYTLAEAPFPADLPVPVPAPTERPETGSPGADGPPPQTLLEVLLRRLAGSGPTARQIWLPPLAEPPALDTLLPDLVVTAEHGLGVPTGPARGTLRVPVGVIDRPVEQRRDPLVADLAGSGGHVGIAGGPRNGKSTLVRTLVLALALTHTPREVQVFCLDFGGGSLSGLAALPHVGSVATRVDRERVNRTIAEVTDLLEQRERSFAAHGLDSIATFRRLRAEGRLPEAVEDGFGDLFLVVDGWASIRQDYEQLEQAFSDLATRGLNYGIHLVVAASRWSEVRPWLRDLLGTRFELHLGDPVESEVGMRVAANVPDVPGRGLTRDGLHFLAAIPRLDGSSEVADVDEAARAATSRVGEAWAGPVSPQVRLLPAILPAGDLPAPEGDVRVALGWDERTVSPVWHDFGQHPHLLALGGEETGTTNLLRLVLRAVQTRYSPEEACVLLADPRRGLHGAVAPEYQLAYAVSGSALQEAVTETLEPLRARVPGAEVSPEELASQAWWSGPRVFLVVDDYDLLGTGLAGPLDALLDLLPQGADIGLHVVVARSTAGASRAMMSDQLLRRLWDLGAPGLLFSCDPQESMVLGDTKPLRLPTGRAQLVTRRRAPVLVQTGLVDG